MEVLVRRWPGNLARDGAQLALLARDEEELQRAAADLLRFTTHYEIAGYGTARTLAAPLAQEKSPACKDTLDRFVESR